jgi:hypothetical protein
MKKFRVSSKDLDTLVMYQNRAEISGSYQRIEKETSRCGEFTEK